MGVEDKMRAHFSRPELPHISKEKPVDRCLGSEDLRIGDQCFGQLDFVIGISYYFFLPALSSIYP
jgi:hypothetical protein